MSQNKNASQTWTKITHNKETEFGPMKTGETIIQESCADCTNSEILKQERERLMEKQFQRIHELTATLETLRAENAALKEQVEQFIQKNDFAGFLNSHFVRRDVAGSTFAKQAARIAELEAEYAALAEINRGLASEEERHCRRAMALEAGLLELFNEAQSVVWIGECRCREDWTMRGMHESNALCGETDGLKKAINNVSALLAESKGGK